MVEQKCAAKVDASLRNSVDTLRDYYQVYIGEAEPTDEINEDSFLEYGLSFDYVPEGTFTDQIEAYFRYQISWGGPSTEYRFYVTNPYAAGTPYRIEYWYLDWFDGAGSALYGEDLELLKDIFELFKDVGVTEAAYTKALDY